MSYASEEGVLNGQWNAAEAAFQAEIARERPSRIWRPKLTPDGTMWCALYGDDLQEGVAGFGETPEAAMLDFDRAWLNDRTPAAQRSTLTRTDQGVTLTLPCSQQQDTRDER